MELECSTINSPRKRAADGEDPGRVKCTNLEIGKQKTNNTAQRDMSLSQDAVPLVQRSPGLQKRIVWWLETMTAIHHFIRGTYLGSIIYIYIIHRQNIRTSD